MTLDERVSAFYVEHRLALYRHLLLMGLSEGDAQDLTQEAFLSLYRTLLQAEDVENWRAWLYKAARNSALNRLHSAGVRLLADPVSDELATSGGDPETQAIESQDRRRIFAAIDGLSSQQRECLYLRADGLEYKAIGSILGIKASTVGEFLRRAIAQLRKAGL